MSSTQPATKSKTIATACAAFAIGFVMVAVLLHLTLRHPQSLHADMRSEKLAMMRQWSGAASSASFGSSHVHNGFDPRIFDKGMAGTPAQSRTVNLAIEGGSQTEQRLMALEFLRSLRPSQAARPQACLLILELAAGANFTTEHLVDPRAINIYDWSTLKFAMRLVSPNMALSQRLGRVTYAWTAMALHYMNIGMMSNRIWPAPLNARMIDEQTKEDRRGLLLVPEPAWMRGIIQIKISQSPPHATAVTGSLVPGNFDLVDELKSVSPVRNLNVVYVVMPMISDLTTRKDYPETLVTAHGPVPVVNLGRPDRYPGLYRSELWLDDAHLNADGARTATGLLAESLKRWYAVHGQPAPCAER